MANRLLIILAAFGCLVAAEVSPAAAQCMLCGTVAPAAAPTLRPLAVEVETSIDFSRLGLGTASANGGTVILDPQTGLRTLQGALVDMGGVAVQGNVTVRGEPNRHVVVTLPARVTMSGPDGETLELGDLATTLKNNPKLGPDGQLMFSLGGRLRVGGYADGDYRGSFPITVDYKPE
jgi:hypothetical protein